MKMIAYYLPQFHQIPENDKWWGEGFTEWTNTRKAVPLFKGHNQPREPLNDYYYDLTNPEVRKWQADIAKQHGVYGFCYYHYWFKGKKLLERPLEDVLLTGEPEFPFCLSWANHDWIKRNPKGKNQILIPQVYGEENDWKEHFYYLLKAFLDKRYIYKNNKPIFLIHFPGQIPNCSKMLSYWNKLAKENGLDGIYFVETMSGQPITNINGFDARVKFEPMYTLSHGLRATTNVKALLQGRKKVFKRLSNKNIRMRIFDYDMVWRDILEHTIEEKNWDKPIFPGAFIDWDNTARRRLTNSIVFEGASPEKFGNYLKKLIQLNVGNEFLFINAWNEWGEGTYLEPDKKNKYQYLEQIKKLTQCINSTFCDF
ncbi:glycoside hydrolase family 99-like domain-containing protein [Metabacillus sediminilitoris]|uniref:Glycosyl transferase n=1 Tax=Metabacillus sediminilitoris TaxID=2567941 RepID=A0A4S4BUY2_9BACI|nr:glycoside hydrolase family 99-like domain-containing protein [Metabacillus sediminilitoris]QGQ44714.1 glycosyl transferase [Metabacillus sediminilitoris]THF78938.1 glycosyl transferase [Metabacillus sediminilitoris]